MSKELAVKVDSVHKTFRLPHDKTSTLKGVFTNLLRGSFLSKSYEMQHALEGISFEVKKGEFFGIVGRNGSGKSTLLKLIAGIYQPTKGEIKTEGRIVPFIELGVGFNAELSGRDNVYLNGAVLGFSKEEIDKKYQEIVTFAELERFMDQKLKNYSSGMQVRLAFSVATVLAESDILLIDEVLAVGDANFQRKCYEYFSGLKKIKKTVIFVTHDMNAVREYCDRAMLIEDGQILMLGGTQAVANRYRRINFEQLGVSKEDSQKEVMRWGNKAATIDSVTIKNATKPNRHIIDKQLEIRAKITFNQTLDNPITGVQIRDAAGTILFGTNTKESGLPPTKRSKGDSASFLWEIPNVFKSGTYFVTIAVHDYSGEPFDWWADAASFVVDKDEDTPALIMVDYKFKTEKMKRD